MLLRQLVVFLSFSIIELHFDGKVSRKSAFFTKANPRGKVVTYGAVANYTAPGGTKRKCELLESEGVRFVGSRVIFNLILVFGLLFPVVVSVGSIRETIA